MASELDDTEESGDELSAVQIPSPYMQQAVVGQGVEEAPTQIGLPGAKDVTVKSVDKDGVVTFSNGVRHFSDGHIEMDAHGSTFVKMNPQSKLTRIPTVSPQVVANPATGEQYLLDKSSGKMSKVQYPVDQALVNLPQGASKDEVLSAMQPDDRMKAMGYAGYKLPISPYGISRDKTLQRLLPYIMKINPEFSAANYKQNADTIADYGTKGKSGQNIASFNMVINHLGHLEDSSQQLGGTKPLTWNQLVQAGGRQLGDPKLASYKTSALAVEQEFARMLKNGATDQKEIDEWRDRLSPANPPEAREAAFRDMVAILKGRLDAVSGNYERITGAPPKGIIFPEADKVLKRHGWNLGDEKQPATAPQPQTQSNPQQYIEWAKAHPEDKRAQLILSQIQDNAGTSPVQTASP